jgi:hypothetical protein
MLHNEVKVKVTRNRPEGPEGGRGIALLFLDLGARRGWVFSTTPRSLYHRERPHNEELHKFVLPQNAYYYCYPVTRRYYLSFFPEGWGDSVF